MKVPLTIERLREAMYYDPQTGIFVWKIKPNRRISIGNEAGTQLRGYKMIRLDGAHYACARVAYLYMTGEWPSGEMDHYDGNPLNNRCGNLRNVTRSENAQNQRRAHRGSTVEYLGVSLNKKHTAYRARIFLDGKETGLGEYDSPILAHTAYVKAKRKLHKAGTL